MANEAPKTPEEPKHDKKAVSFDNLLGGMKDQQNYESFSALIEANPFRSGATADLSTPQKKKLAMYDSALRSLHGHMKKAKEAGDEKMFRVQEDRYIKASILRDRLLREARRSKQNPVENFVEEASDFVTGLFTIAKGAISGGIGIVKGDITLDDAGESLKNMSHIIWDGIVEGFEKWDRPMSELLSTRPLETVLDLQAAFSIAGGAIGRGATAAGKFAAGADISNVAKMKWAKMLVDNSLVDVRGTGLRALRPNLKARTSDARQMFNLPVPESGFLGLNLHRVGKALGTSPISMALNAGRKGLGKLREKSTFVNDMITKMGATMPAQAARKIMSGLVRSKARFLDEAGTAFLKAAKKRFGGVSDDMMRAVSVRLTGLDTAAIRSGALAGMFRVGKEMFWRRRSGKYITVKGSPVQLRIRHDISDAMKAQAQGILDELKRTSSAESLALKTKGIERLVKHHGRLAKRYKDELAYINKLQGDELKKFNEVVDFLKEHQGLLETTVGGILPESQLRNARYRFLSKELRVRRKDKGSSSAADEFRALSRENPDIFDVEPVYFTPPPRLRNDMFRTDAAARAAGLSMPSKIHSGKDLKHLRSILDNKKDFRITVADIVAHNTVQTSYLKMLQRMKEEVISSGVARRVKSVKNITEKDLKTHTIWTPAAVERKLISELNLSKKLQRGLDRHFGPGEVSAEGLFGTVKELFGRQFHGEMAKDVRKLIKAQDEVYLIPKEMATTLRNGLTKSAATGVLGLYDDTMSLWRSAILHWNPGWYIQNMVGNVILSIMSGHALGQVGWAYRGYKNKAFRDLIPDEVLGGLGPEVREIYSQIYKEAGDIGSKVHDALRRGAAPDTLSHFANWMENGHRTTVFLSSVNKQVKKQVEFIKELGASGKKSFDTVKAVLQEAKTGKGLRGAKAKAMVKEAVEDVNKTLFDYYNLTAAERGVLRRFFPFWTWTRNVNLMIGRFAERRLGMPLQSVAWQRLSKMGIDMRDDEEMPRWLRGSILLGGMEDGGFLFLNTRRHNPFLTIGLQGVSPSAASPFIKVMYERSTGINTWRNMPFRHGEAGIMYNGKSIRYDEKTGRMTSEPFVPPLVTHLLDQFPQHYWIDNILHPYMQTDDGNVFNPKPVRNTDGTPKYPNDQWLAITAALGVPITKLTGEQIEDLKTRKLMQMRGAVRKLKSAMKRAPEDMWPAYMSAIEDIIQNEHKMLNEWER